MRASKKVMGLEKISIIGNGDFGALLSRLLPETLELLMHDSDQSKPLPDNAKWVELPEAATADIVFIATPFEAMPELCKRLAAHVCKDTIVADLCSVKVKPAELLQRNFLGKANFVSTHPLFGPNSAPNRDAAQGKELVWSELEGGGDTEPLRALFNDLGLRVIEMNPEEHDKEMAWIHALTFFIGRALVEIDIPELQLSTGYFEKLLALRDLEKTQSYDLFTTVERHNPQAGAIRQNLMKVFTELEYAIQQPAVTSSMTESSKTDNSQEVARIRSEIDEVDDELNRLLARRSTLAKEMFVAKGGQNIYRPEREEAIIRRIISEHGGDFVPDSLEQIFRAIIKASRDQQTSLSLLQG